MTEYQQLEEALKKCEEKFSKAFRESPLILALTSAVDHRYIDVNDSFERISGWNRNEIVGRTPFDLGIWVDPSQRIDFVKRLLTGETVRNLEVRVRLKNGQIRTISGSGVLIEIRSETCVLSLITDITDLRTAEEAKRIAEQHAAEAEQVAKGLSNAAQKLIQAHDDERADIVRELHGHIDRLTVLSMLLHRIRQSPPGSLVESNPEIAEALREVDDLVNEVQTLSERLHSSRLEYLGLAAAATAFCKELSNQKEVRIAFAAEDIPDRLSEKISVCLFRVLQEALQIATEHSVSRELEVLLAVESDEIHVIVRDSGTGFDPEVAERSGIGLTIMRERVNILGGKLWIEFPGKRGTAIHARVPINPRSYAADIGGG